MKEVDEKIYCTILNQLNHNRLSHAYLIETDDYLNIEVLMNKIVKTILCSKQGIHETEEDCNVCNLIDLDQCNDLKLIYPDGNMIKKEQLLEVKKLFKTTSLNPYRVYIIYGADKLNQSSANTILKFLEEPEAGIVAFLVAKSRYQVLETLVSRCQILSIHHSNIDEFDDVTMDLLKKLTQNSDFYLDFKDILANYLPDKNTAKIVLDHMELFFHQLLLSRTDESISVAEKEFFTNLSKNSIISYISILEEEKQKLLYNVNYRLWLDNLLVRFLEVISC